MISIWRRISTGITILSISVAMLLVNLAFETAGSVPDFPEFGFLAGSLSVLYFIYPAIVFFIVSLYKTKNSLASIRQCGFLGFSGSVVYVLTGVVNSVGVRQITKFTLMDGSLLMSIIVVCTVAGLLAGTHIMRYKPFLALSQD